MGAVMGNKQQQSAAGGPLCVYILHSSVGGVIPAAGRMTRIPEA